MNRHAEKHLDFLLPATVHDVQVQQRVADVESGNDQNGGNGGVGGKNLLQRQGLGFTHGLASTYCFALRSTDTIFSIWREMFVTPIWSFDDGFSKKG